MEAPNNIETPSRGILLGVTPFAVLTAVVMYLFFDQRGWSIADVAFEVVLVVVCLCLVLAVIGPRAFWWAPRIIAFIIFASYLGYLAHELITQPFVAPHSKGAANPINAILGFCFFGIPCLLYALSGSTIGPIAGKADAEVTPKDLWYLKVAMGARWLFLAVSILVVIASLIRVFVREGSMSTELKVLLFLVVVVAVWLFVRWRSPRPDFPPLNTSPDDPLMIEALQKAKASVSEFKRLLKEAKLDALIKIRFVSSSNQVEHLWAEVLEVRGDNELEVRLMTPPVTHSGHLDRLWRCSFEDIEDWQIRDSSGRVHGGFSQRAMFAIARREGIKLPKKLLAHEKEYS